MKRHILGQRPGNVLEVTFDILGHTYCIDSRLFRYRKDYGRSSIERCVSLLYSRCNEDISNIGDTYGHIAHDLDDSAAKLIDIIAASHATQVVLITEVAYDACSDIHAHCARGSLEFGHADAVHLHTHRVGKHLVLLVVTTYYGNVRDTACRKYGWFYYPLGKRTELHH